MKDRRKAVHTHKYFRVDIGTKQPYLVYRCGDAFCPAPGHYMTSALIIGERTRCWSCDEIISVTKPMLRRVKLKCQDCKRTVAEKERTHEIANAVEDLLAKVLK